MFRKGTAVIRTQAASAKKSDDILFVGTLGINCVDYTKRCIDTLRSNAKCVIFFYMDNGSTEESLKIIRSWNIKNPDIDSFNIIENGENIGVAPGWNKLIIEALKLGATKIALVNNDIAFGPYTLDGMCEAFDRLRAEVPETVMVTATNHTKDPTNLNSIKQVWKYHEHPDFSCFMITPEFMERIGYFYEGYKPAFFEDNDTHWTILMRGYKAFGTDWAPYSHIASRTRHAHPNLVTHEMFRRNKLHFFQKFHTISVDQEHADRRYAAWLEKNPDQKHPLLSDVMKFCLENNVIDPKLVADIKNLTIHQVP